MSENKDEERPDPEDAHDDVPSQNQKGRKAERGGRSGKVAAVAVAILLVAGGLAAMLLHKPEGGGGGRHNPPPIINDTMSAVPVFISEVMPAYGATGSPGAFVEIRAASNITDLKDWRLTTYDNDSYLLPGGAVTQGSNYVLLDFSGNSTTLSLGALDELGLYEPGGELVDFLRWGGGNSNTTRGCWSASDPGPSPSKGQSVSRLDTKRYSPGAWMASPPSPGGPNILVVKPSGLPQVIWVRSGRNFTTGPGPDGAPAIARGEWVSRDLLDQTAGHLEYALRQMKRLGEPLGVAVTPEGASALEFWVTNGSTYQGMTENGGRVSIDLGENGHINSYICAREMARLIETGHWGAPAGPNMFIREGMAMLEGLRAAAFEIAPSQPSIDGLLGEMRLAGLANPFVHGLDPKVPFISPWAYGPDQAVCSWLFVDFCERRFLDAGLGTSLSQAMLASPKDPLVSLPEQLGRNLTAIYWDWLAWRSPMGFKYPPFITVSTLELGNISLEDKGPLEPWTGRCWRINISLSGMAELNLLAPESSSGPLQFLAFSNRNGSLLARTVVWPGQSFPLLVQDLQPLDELFLVAGAGDSGGQMVCQAQPIPPPPGDMDPRDGNYTNQSQPLFAWSGINGLSEYELQLSQDRSFGSPELSARTAATSIAPQEKLSDGCHYWRVRGWTPLGHPTAWSRVHNITVDTVPPFSAPIIGEPRYRGGPDDRWNVSESTQISFNHESIDTLFFRFADTDVWQVFSTGFVLSGQEGPRQIQYRSRDLAGNYQPVQLLEMNLDVQPPVVSVDFGKPSFAAGPGDTMNVSHASRVALRATDNMSGVSELRYRLDGLAWNNYSGEFDLSGLPEGSHILATSSSDRLGNGAQQMSRFIVDSTPPVLTFRSITNGSYVFGDIRIWINASDACGIGSVGYFVDNIQFSTATSPPFEWIWHTSGVVDGFHQLDVRVQDNVGNTVSDSVTVATENTQPSTTISVGEPRYRASPGDIWNVTWSTSFNLSVMHSFSATTPIIPVWYTIDGVFNEGTTFKLLGRPNGRHNITFGSRGVSGLNETAKSISFELENIPPMPVIMGPIQDELVCGTVLVNVTEGTNATDIRNCTLYYSTDSVNWIFAGVDSNGMDGWNVTWDTTVLSNGNFWIKAEMVDFLDNRGSSMISVNVQNT